MTGEGISDSKSNPARRSSLDFWLAFLLYTVVFLIGVRPIWTGEGIPAWDAFNYYAPAQGLVADHARHGELLLWNPWIGGGRPEGTDPQVGAFSPFNVFLGLVAGGSPGGFKLYWLVSWWLGGVGFLLLARHLGAPAWAAFLGAISFSCSGFQTGHATHASVLQGMSWLPWIVWRLDAALLSGRWLPAVQAGAFWGLSALASYPQITILSAGFAGLWTLARWLEEATRMARGQALRGAELAATAGRRLVSKSLRLAVLAAVGLVVLAPTYLGFFIEFEGYDLRVDSLPRSIATTSNALDPRGLLTFASPYVTYLHFLNRKLISTNPTSTSIYLSAALLAMALAALLIRERRPGDKVWRWALLIVGVLFLMTALGRDLPLRGWLYDFFPPSRYFRHAAKFRGYYLFCLLVLAMEFCRQAWTSIEPAARRATWRALVVTSAAAATTAAAAYQAAAAVITKPGPHFSTSLAWALGLWLATAAAGLLAWRWQRAARLLVPALLIVLTSFDAWSNFYFVRSLAYHRHKPLLKEWTKVEEEYSPALEMPSFERLEKSPYANGYNNLNAYPKIPALRSYGSFFSRAVKAWFDTPVLARAATGNQRIWFSETAAVVEPRLQLIPAFSRRSQELEAPIILLAEPSCESAGRVGEGKPAVRIRKAPPARPLAMALETYRPNRLRFRVDAPADGWLMVTERYARGWRARVDGRAREICVAGFLFRGLAITRGRHLIEMEFRPWGYPWLVFASWTTLLAIGALSLRRRREADPPRSRSATG